MLNIPLPIYVAFFFFLGCMLLLELHMHYRRKQEELPALNVFLTEHQMAEPACHACGSHEFKEIGLLHSDDPNRIVSCNTCNTLLYRFERPELEAAD